MISLLALAACAERAATPVTGRSVVINIAFEPRLAGNALIRGRRTALPPNLPSNVTVAEALLGCGQTRFLLLGGGSEHWEAVAFPSGPEHRRVLNCVADHVSFDLVASYTSDPVITSSSRFEPILGI
jgi:hypothetical protein